MENKETPTRIVSCDDCKYEWLYSETNLVETRWKDDKDELFVLLSFSCPNCGKQYIVCVDNEITLSERAEVVKVQKSIQRTLRNSKGNIMPVYHALMAKRERLLVRLTKHQDTLKEAYLARVASGVLKEAN